MGAWLAVVCDGMGGPAGGEVASTMSVELISKDIVSGYTTFLSEDELLELVRDAIGEANTRVFEYSMRDLELAGMGTTVVLALATEQTAYLANVGDSRAYLYSCHNGQHKLTQITHDHSVVQELVDGGSLSSEEARNHPKEHYHPRSGNPEQRQHRLLQSGPGSGRQAAAVLGRAEQHARRSSKSAPCCKSRTQPRRSTPSSKPPLDAGANDNVTAVLISR